MQVNPDLAVPPTTRNIPVQQTSQESNLTSEQDALLKKLYYNDALFVGRDRLYKYVAANHPEAGISRRDVMTWLKLQTTWQLTARPPKKAKTSLIDIRKPGYMSCDLKGPLANDQGFTFVFGIVDVASRKQYTKPIRNPSAQASVDALNAIIKENDLKISLLRSDNGTSFKGVFTENLKEKGIVQLFSAPHSPWQNRQERNWRTMFDMVYKYQIANNTNSWVTILPTIVNNMNNTVVSSIKLTPNQAQDGLPEELNVQRSKQYGVMKRFNSNYSTLKVGDFVRLKIRNKGTFSKDKQTYTSEIFVISKVINATNSKMVTYKITKDGLENEKPSYNLTDLLLVNDSQDLPEFAKLDDTVGDISITDQREVNELLINTPEVNVIRETRRPAPDENDAYEIEKIISTRKFGKVRKYLLKYKGFPLSESTWEKASDIDAPELMAEFRKQMRQKKKK